MPASCHLELPPFDRKRSSHLPPNRTPVTVRPGVCFSDRRFFRYDHVVYNYYGAATETDLEPKNVYVVKVSPSLQPTHKEQVYFISACGTGTHNKE